MLDTGYHRTELEYSRRELLRERFGGARVQYLPDERMAVGLTGAAFSYAPGFAEEDPEKVLKRLTARKLTCAGVDWSVTTNRMQLFGEAAVSNPGRYGFIGGTVIHRGGNRIGVVYRDYAYDFYAPYGCSFADDTGEIRNEKGLYLGVRSRLNDRIEAAGYVDIFQRPWRTYYIPIKEEMKDYYFRLSADPKNRYSFYCSVSRSTGIIGSTYEDEQGEPYKVYEDETLDRVRFNIEHERSLSLRISSRLEIRTYRKAHDRRSTFDALITKPGILWYLKARYAWRKKTKFTVQTVLFSSNSTRLYSYEPDFIGSMTIKQFNGKGERLVFMVNHTCFLGTFSARYGIVHYPEKEEVGTGYYMVPQNYRQDFGFQWDFAFRDRS